LSKYFSKIQVYRYGQKKKVVVFNIFSPQSLDGNIIELLYERIDTVVQDMAILGGEFKPGLESEILGEIAEFIEIDDILQRSLHEKFNQTEDKIKEAIKKAKLAVEKQRDLLEYASGYDPESASDELKITLEHLKAFVKGMLFYEDLKVVEETNKGDVWKIELSDAMRDELALRKRYLFVTFNREIAIRRKDVRMMDLDNPFFRSLISKAKKYSFDGRVCKLNGLDQNAVVTAMLRWQNDQGVRMRQEYFIALVAENHRIEKNSEKMVKWLLTQIEEADNIVNETQESSNQKFKAAWNSMDLRLDEISNNDIHPENRQVVSAALHCS